MDIVDTALSLVTDLTTQIIELETRLASQTPLFDDEAQSHRQLADLTELYDRSQSLEKSIKELLIQSKQLGNEKLNRTSDQLVTRWKQINTEINQRFVLFSRIENELFRILGTILVNDQLRNVSKLVDRFKQFTNKKIVCLIT